MNTAQAPPEYEDYSQPAEAAAPSGGSKFGKCCLFGCVGLLILAVVGGIGLYFSIPYMIGRVILPYTDEQAIELPKVEIADDEYAALQARTDAFETALEAGEPMTLKLSSRDVNALIARHPGELWTLMRGKLYVEIEDDLITGQLSLPLDEFAKKSAMLRRAGLGGRFLNATGTFKVSLRDGYLIVRLDQASVKGEPVPENAMSGFRQTNLAEDAQRNNPKFQESLRKLESIEVEDGSLIIKAGRPKPKAPQPMPPGRGDD